MKTKQEIERELKELRTMRRKYPESKPWTEPLIKTLLWVLGRRAMSPRFGYTEGE